jgi:hypothetical protein
MSLINSTAIPNGVLPDFPLTQSVKLKGNGYLHNTPSNASNRKTFTFSAWVKRSKIGGQQTIFLAYGAQNNLGYNALAFSTNNQLNFGGWAADWLNSTALFRDASAWYHIVLAVNTTLGTANDRIKLYVNGTQLTDFGTRNNPSQNDDFAINNAVPHNIGSRAAYQADDYLNGYLAEVNFIDGLALDPTSFGRLNAHGAWQAIDTQDLTFGTNGFSMKFNSSGNLGLTGSGTNTDTVANWSVVSIGAENQVLDTPTNNFATLNPLWQDSSITLQEGNLRSSRNANMNRPSLSTISLGTGKWYFEALDKFTGGNQIGVEWEGADVATYVHDSGTQAYTFASSGGTYGNGSSGFGNNGGSVTSGARIRMIAYDGATGKLWGGANGTWGSSGNPAAGSNQSMIVPAAYRDKMHFIVATENSTTSQGIIANFGQDSSFAGHKTSQGNDDGNDIGDFYYTPPSGFLALCTSNLPDVDVVPSKNFNTVIYTGDGNTTNAITGVGFQPDFTWIKHRTATYNHALFDTVRGATKELASNTTGAEATETTSLKSFNADGFTLGDKGGVNNSTGSANNFVAWNWKAATAFSNDASATSVGSIDSAGKVNVDAGFSIIGWAGTGNAGTIAHGLSKAPEMIWVKNRNKTSQFAVYYGDNTDYLALTDSDATADYAGYWNDTSPTSTVFSVGSDGDVHGASNQNVIAYCFHSVDGYSKVSSYVGNGSAGSANQFDGTFVYTGFQPKFLLFKRLDTGARWYMWDDAREPHNPMDSWLNAEGTNVETTELTSGYEQQLDFLSNGFKLKGPSGGINSNGKTYVYIAFAETPFKYSNAK